MPVHFQLYKHDSDTPETLSQVDKVICAFIGVEVDPVYWVADWYNTIGFSLALGHSFDKIRELFPDKVQITNFIEDNYDVINWR